MNNTDLSLTVAKNIAMLRKEAGYTQLSLAQNLNYSDKAISKWERGESLPDIYMLKSIADLFGVTVDYLLEDEHKETNIKKRMSHNKKLIMFGSVISVWVITTLLFVGAITLGILKYSAWKLFIYTVPVSLILFLIFNSIWGGGRKNRILISLLVWSLLLSLYISLLNYNLWQLFLIGLPVQIVILVFSSIKKSE